jgi:hypothetical protein
MSSPETMGGSCETADCTATGEGVLLVDVTVLVAAAAAAAAIDSSIVGWTKGCCYSNRESVELMTSVRGGGNINIGVVIYQELLIQ